MSSAAHLVKSALPSRREYIYLTSTNHRQTTLTKLKSVLTQRAEQHDRRIDKDRHSSVHAHHRFETERY